MTEQSPDLRGQAVGPPYARTARGRHAIPRTSALTRLRLPLGRALALTALPTVLVLASQRPPAVDTSATAAHSAPEEEPGGGADCARPDGTAAPATAPTPSAAPSTPSTSSVPTSGEPAKPSEHAADEETGLAPAPTATPSATAATTTGLTGILGSLLRGETEQQSRRLLADGDAEPDPVDLSEQVADGLRDLTDILADESDPFDERLAERLTDLARVEVAEIDLLRRGLHAVERICRLAEAIADVAGRG